MKHAHAQSKRACADVYSVYIYIYRVKCAYAQLNVCTCSTGSVQWLCKIPFSQVTSFKWWDLMAGVFPLETHKKNTVEPSSRGQCWANADLFFEMGSTLSLQWLCKIPFSQLASFFWLLNMFVVGIWNVPSPSRTYDASNNSSSCNYDVLRLNKKGRSREVRESSL